MPLRFEWDSKKAASSVTKHGVTFDEATTVFGDPLAVIFDDEGTSKGLLIRGQASLIGDWQLSGYVFAFHGAITHHG